MNEEGFRKRLKRKKGESTLQLLFRTSRLTNDWAVARAQTQKGPILRSSHTTLLPHIDLEGTRITTLAERVGITKQAVSELIEEMEEMGTVEKIPDPSDGRAKLVRFSQAGRRNILRGLNHLLDLEEELAEVIGERRMKNLNQTLSLLMREVESRLEE